MVIAEAKARELIWQRKLQGIMYLFVARKLRPAFKARFIVIIETKKAAWKDLENVQLGFLFVCLFVLFCF